MSFNQQSNQRVWTDNFGTHCLKATKAAKKKGGERLEGVQVCYFEIGGHLYKVTVSYNNSATSKARNEQGGKFWVKMTKMANKPQNARL